MKHIAALSSCLVIREEEVDGRVYVASYTLFFQNEELKLGEYVLYSTKEIYDFQTSTDWHTYKSIYRICAFGKSTGNRNHLLDNKQLATGFEDLPEFCRYEKIEDIPIPAEVLFAAQQELSIISNMNYENIQEPQEI